MTAPGTTTAPEPARAAGPFGMELAINLAGCNPDIINSPDRLVDYVTSLAAHIGMTTYGPAQVEYFGEGDLAGWTVIQLITTSNINLHAVDTNNTCYINVFSCRPFDAETAATFTADYFDAGAYTTDLLERRAPTERIQP